MCPWREKTSVPEIWIRREPAAMINYYCVLSSIHPASDCISNPNIKDEDSLHWLGKKKILIACKSVKREGMQQRQNLQQQHLTHLTVTPSNLQPSSELSWAQDCQLTSFRFSFLYTIQLGFGSVRVACFHMASMQNTKKPLPTSAACMMPSAAFHWSCRMVWAAVLHSLNLCQVPPFIILATINKDW